MATNIMQEFIFDKIKQNKKEDNVGKFSTALAYVNTLETKEGGKKPPRGTKIEDLTKHLFYKNIK